MRSVTIDLPFPPTVNTYWRSRVIVSPKPGKKPFTSTYISEKGKEYSKQVSRICLAKFGDYEPIKEPVSLQVQVTLPTNHKRDLDNLLKAPLDALTKAGIWEDDSQIEFIQVDRIKVHKPGGLRISMSIDVPKFTRAPVDLGFYWHWDKENGTEPKIVCIQEGDKILTDSFGVAVHSRLRIEGGLWYGPLLCPFLYK